MTSLALLMLWLELKFLARLFIDPEDAGPLPVQLATTPTDRSASHASPAEPAPVGEVGP